MEREEPIRRMMIFDDFMQNIGENVCVGYQAPNAIFPTSAMQPYLPRNRYTYRVLRSNLLIGVLGVHPPT